MARKKHLGNTNQDRIPIIDLFAGPGGLGEGFSQAGEGRLFDVKLSVEMDKNAHSTLRLRSLQRKLPQQSGIPESIIEHAKGRLDWKELKNYYPENLVKDAENEALCARLGADNKIIHEAIRKKLSGVIKSGKWILIGGPPCQAYSLAGRSRKSKDLNSGKYSKEDDERNFLYQQYLDIVSKFSPAVFVMENVRGILSARVSGYHVFSRIQKDLENPGNGHTYRLFSVSKQPDPEPEETKISAKTFIVKAEDYGIPQRRHRVIIVGVRDDFEIDPRNLILHGKPFVTCQNAIGDLPKIRSKRSRGEDSHKKWCSVIKEPDWDSISEEIWAAKGEGGSCFFSDLGVSSLIGNSPKVTESFIVTGKRNKSALKSWYHRVSSNEVFNHEARGHMDTDLHRYRFSAIFAKAMYRSPKLSDFPTILLPNHANVQKSISSNALFADRFRVQVADEPSTTVTSHICKDGHGFIHYDPDQCRSLSVREAARLQTFPDDYIFLGSRTAQYHQVGNAVPPYLAFQIAQGIADAMGLEGRKG